MNALPSIDRSPARTRSRHDPDVYKRMNNLKVGDSGVSKDDGPGRASW